MKQLNAPEKLSRNEEPNGKSRLKLNSSERVTRSLGIGGTLGGLGFFIWAVFLPGGSSFVAFLGGVILFFVGLIVLFKDSFLRGIKKAIDA